MSYPNPGIFSMSKPTTRNRNTEKTMIKIPKRDEVMVSLPVCSFSGLPPEVSTMALPPSTAKNAIPPATPKTMDRIDFTNSSGFVDKHPKTV